MNFPEAFDLSFLENELLLAQVVKDQFQVPATTLSKVGQGFYAHVYRASLDSEPGDVILKCHHYPGRARKEKAQLEILRQHASVKVPEVYTILFQCGDALCEILVMEHIPGVKASQIEFPDDDSRARFVDKVIENLLAWHSVGNPEGFGELDGPFYETWLEALSVRIGLYHEHIHKEKHKATVSEYVLSIIGRSFEALASIFQQTSQRSSLVHSDYNAWNMMVDPETFTLTGVIDPIDAGWSDPEIDLFHLPNARPDFGLLDRYLQEIQVDESFWARFHFYKFWDDVKHYLRMGWYEEARFRSYAQDLEKAMNGCGY
jgi:aminoglycoside phosphotransferase (APT) family kinase protein